MTIERPSNFEDEYFARENAERLRKLHYEEQKRLRQSEKDALRALHAGRCSQCGALMVPEDAGGVRILHCPACGGAFLDKATWHFLHAHSEPHRVIDAVLNWFKSANKP
ncbi:MAG: hypothetical protein E6J58_09705 [Deltaproteobacteria bacterium]|nr:MAG: hypothetical protein E6J67_01575 [Deltaproteobacteria bacterium]TMB38100.1 MAG: hypothetical protein E6J58_09705 [Deltaproteobacteria bacterium]